MQLRSFILFLLLLAFAGTTRAEDHPTVLVVLGAEGTPEFGADFNKSVDNWAAAAKTAGANFVLIGRDDLAAKTDRQRLQETLESQSKETTQPLWLVLIGHGTYDGHDAKFNLRDLDFTDQELTTWLKPFTRPLAVIDCSSSSGTFLTRLSSPGGGGRVVITATRSGSEVNYARFGLYMSVAIADPAADLDKDGQTSLLEAFLAASRRTEDFYKTEGRIATEHALLDDNGDSLGASADWFNGGGGIRATRSARNGAPVDGTRAHQWHLIRTAAERAIPPPELRHRRDDLELKIEALRAKKTTLPEKDYYAQLETLLLDLAHIYEQAGK